EWSEDISEQSQRKSAKTSSHAHGVEVDFGYSEAPRSNFKVIAAGAGALVVVLAVVGWMFMGGSQKPEAGQVPSFEQVQQQAQPNQEQAPVSAYTQPGSAAPSTDQAPTVNESVTVEAGPNAATPGKPKKPTPTPSKSPDKKKVTVDDLINDN